MPFIPSLPLPRHSTPTRRLTQPRRRFLRQPYAKHQQQAPPTRPRTIPTPPPTIPSTPPSPPSPTQKPGIPPLALATTLSLLGLTTLLLLTPDTNHLQASFNTALNDFITGPHLPITLDIFLSALIQALTGFGFAIVSVASLTNHQWIANSTVIQSVQPLAATLGAFTAWILLLPEIKQVKWATLRPLLISSTLLTPVGLALSAFDTSILLKVLGGLITSYVVYTKSGVKLPPFLATTPGAWLMGSLAGIFGGLFDITGPALVIFGDAKGWGEDFRRNVLAVLSVNSTIVVLTDLLVGRLDDFYYIDFVTWAFPAAVAGIISGLWMGRQLNPAGFKNLVLATCFVVGIKLMIF